MAENLVIKHGNKGSLPSTKTKGTIYFAQDSSDKSHGKIYYDDPVSNTRADMTGCGYDVGNGAEIFNDYNGNTATGSYSHAEGQNTQATNSNTHAEGFQTTASGLRSHAEGSETVASGSMSHAGGQGTKAAGQCQTAIGKYNIEDSTKAFIIGNGTDTERSNALAVDWYGNADFSGTVTSNGKELLASSDASNTYAKLSGGNTFSGNQTINGTLAQGSGCSASGPHSYAGGWYTVANGGWGCHTEGNGSMTNAPSGEGANHAEGWWTGAYGSGAHAEGYSDSKILEKESGIYSNDSQVKTNWNNNKFLYAKGKGAHAEGWSTLALGTASHAQGKYTISNGEASHTEGYYTKATEEGAHAEGSGISTNPNQATAQGAHAEGTQTQATAQGAHSEGVGCTASGAGAHAEGDHTSSSGVGSHSEGQNTKATLEGCHSEGIYTQATAQGAHAEGVGTKSDNVEAKGTASHAEGYKTKATGEASHAEGRGCKATGNFSHAAGLFTQAVGTAQTVVGRYNQGRSDDAAGPDSFFIVGVGTSATEQSNGFRVDRFGNCFSKAGLLVHQNTADFAEYFEWEDGNLLNEDRRGLFVTLNNNKIRLANLNDTYILGAISTTGAFIGNAGSEEWKNRFVKNIFEEIQYEDVVVSTEETLNNGEVIVKETIEKHPILNPDYNSEEEYIPRSERLEWDVVGLCGQVIVVDDGTCEVNGYCRPYVDGIASSFTINDIDENIPDFMKEFYLTTKGFRVMERLDENHIKVLIK